ncbi:hypothetical protein ACFLZH_02660 [Patescibacteria group bacterium]
MEWKEWKQLEKKRLSSNIGHEAYERLRFEAYITKKKIGQIVTELAMEHLEEPPDLDELKK